MIDALTIRLAGPEDNVAISRVHQASIRGLCSTHYEPQQIEVWASRHTPEFYARVLDSHELFVAERDGTVVAFGQLDLENGTISSVCAPGSMSQIVRQSDRNGRAGMPPLGVPK